MTNCKILIPLVLMLFACTEQDVEIMPVFSDDYSANILLTKELHEKLRHSLSSTEIRQLDQMSFSVDELKSYLGDDRFGELRDLSNKINWALLTKDVENQNRFTNDIFVKPEIDEAELVAGNAIATPCYNSWEKGHRLAASGYVTCLFGSFETAVGPLVCSIGYVAAFIIIEDAYNKCIKTTYGYTKG